MSGLIQAGIKIGRRNTNNLKSVDDTTLMRESEEELKNLLMRVKEGSEKVSLKIIYLKKNQGVWPHHFMTNRRGKDGSSDRFPLHGL